MDAGCGQGIVATYLAQKYGVKTFGISITPFEIEKAKKLAKKLKLEDRCTFKVMDYTH